MADCTFSILTSIILVRRMLPFYTLKRESVFPAYQLWLKGISRKVKTPVSVSVSLFLTRWTGEELFASYVNPSLPWPSRQVKLREWSFGKCQCERCVKEEVEMPELAAQTAGEDKGFDMGDLEKELKAGFGVF